MCIYNKYKNILLNLKNCVSKFICNTIVKKYKYEIISVLVFILFYELIYFIPYITDSLTKIFIYILIIITIYGYILYKKFLTRFKMELEDIDNMQQFIIDEEYKFSLDFSKRCDDIFIKLFAFSFVTVSSVVYSHLGKDSLDINLIKDFLSQEIFYLIGIILYSIFVGIYALSLANSKKIKELRSKYKKN